MTKSKKTQILTQELVNELHRLVEYEHTEELINAKDLTGLKKVQKDYSVLNTCCVKHLTFVLEDIPKEYLKTLVIYLQGNKKFDELTCFEDCEELYREIGETDKIGKGMVEAAGDMFFFKQLSVGVLLGLEPVPDEVSC